MTLLHVSPLQKIDLNLLGPLHALLEERNVTRAARRLQISQPAMSRNLERLRLTFRDVLLVRTPKGYVLTHRGAELLEEVQRLMPQLEVFWTGKFRPETTTATLRIAMIDLVATQLLPTLMGPLREQAPSLILQIIPWSEQPFEDLAHGKIDLLLCPITVPPVFCSELLYEDKYSCVFSEQFPFRGKALSMEQYLASKHIIAEVPGGQQTLIDPPLLDSGIQRLVGLRLPYFLPALSALLGTDLLLTVASRAVQPLLPAYNLLQSELPPEITAAIKPLRYSLVWHPRSQMDALHLWFRRLVQATCLIAR